MSRTPNISSSFILSVDQLYKKCDLTGLDFTTTNDLQELEQIIGQDRALKAIDFGMGMDHKGYNLFILGSEGIGKTALIKQLLKKHYVNHKKTFDWCYVNNFEYPQHPRFLRLPAGTVKSLSEAMEKLVKLISTLITAAFQSNEYSSQVTAIENAINERGDKVLNELIDKAKENDVAVIRTPSGYTLSAIIDGNITDLSSFKQLDKIRQEEFNKRIDNYQEQLQDALAKVPVWEQEGKDQLDALDKDIVTQLVDTAMLDLFKNYKKFAQVIHYLTDVKDDIINHLDEFYEEDIRTKENGQKRKHISKTASFHRYLVNVLVDNSESTAMPVIFEDNPTYSNLIGRIEHLAFYNPRESEQNKSDNDALSLGNLLTAFTLIKPGSLHRANDGYLLLDAEKILVNPYAWDGLKRALKSSNITIEPLDELHSFSRNLTLEPDPIPLKIKVILIGDRHIYHLLKENDPEFNKLFKVNVDFSEEMDRSDKMIHKYARLIANLQQQEKIHPIERSAVERIIEHSSRQVDHSEKISLHMGDLRDLILEADFFQQKRQQQRKYHKKKKNHKKKNNTINLKDVNCAISARIYRMDQYRDRLYEEIIKGMVLIDTNNEKIGQVNALSVLQIGEFAFGQPSRITATVRIGEGHIVDIEREVDLGGEIHSKGVMILSSYLGHHYAKTQNLSLDANLTFEQSYGQVDGDSASVAELCALLSAVADIPVKQNFALTGSVNQLGEVQAIGGVNEKIEGFFDICNLRGLNGDQGVIIPKSNVINLMLKQDVLDAVKNGQFSIYSIEHVDDALTLLMGMTAGKADVQGNYPEQSVNYLIQSHLEKYSSLKYSEQHKYDK